jgi:hypothetical protein
MPQSRLGGIAMILLGAGLMLYALWRAAAGQAEYGEVVIGAASGGIFVVGLNLLTGF